MAIGRITGQMLSANLARSGTDLAFETNLLVLDVTNSRVGVGTASPATTFHVSATDAIRLPSGNTAQRPGSPANGDIRYNSDTGAVEGYAGGWLKMTGGTSLADADGDTQIEVERTADEDAIHFEIGGTDAAHIRANGNIELNNLQIADTTISTLSTNGDLTLTPNGTGKVIVTDGTTLQTNTADINGGAIDGTTIGANAAAAGTFTTLNTSGNATISGNLTVTGTTTTVSTTNTTISDNIIELNSGISSSSNDSGLIIERGSTGNNAAILWDESADKFTMGTTTATAADKSSGVSVTKGTLVADLEGDVTGALTGNADTATALATARNIAGQSFDGTGDITIASTDLSNTSAIVLATSTHTLTNKTIDANGTGNVISNIDSGNFLSGFFLDEDNMASNDATAVASQQSIKAYVDAEDANIASDTLTFTNKTIDANGTGNVISNIDSGNFLSGFFLDEDNMASNDATAVASQQSIKAYVDTQDAAIASDTLTLTNKTFDANGTGNSLSNVDIADFTSGVFLDEDNMASDSATAIASQQSIKAYVDTEIGNVSTTSISQGNSSATISDTGSDGAFTVVADGNTELVINDTSATFSGNVIMSGNLTVNGTTTTVATTNTTIADNIIELNSGISASSNDSGILIERGSTGNNAFIGWDESEDKFTVGTTTATAADKSGGISVTKGTLVADLEGDVTGDVTGTVSDISNHLLDEDNMASDSATKAPSQQSVKAYVDAQDAAIASDTLTFTNKTIDANGTGNVISNIDIGNMTAAVVVLEAEGIASNDNDTTLPTSASVKDYVDTQDAAIASDTLTFTNKTIDANGTGNVISNIDSGNFLSGFFLDEDNMASDSATSVASQQSIKAYVDSQVTAQDLDFTADDSTTNSIDLDSEVMQFSGGTGITTSATGNTVTTAIDSTVTTLTGSQTLTNKTLTTPTLTSPVLNTGVSGTAILDEDNMATNSDTQLATQQSIKAYVDAEDANIASDTLTLTNKTFDANGTGNSLTNIDSGNFLSGFFLDEDNMASDSATSVASQQSIKAYVDTEIGNVSTTSISQGNSSATISDTGSDGAFTVVADGNTELVVNDTSATFSGNVIVSGDFTVNGTTTTIDSTTLTVEDPLIQLAKNNSGGAANAFDQGLFFNRGSLDNVSFMWDESEDQFVFAVTSGEDGTTAGNITIDSYAALKAGVITGSDVETGVISAADGTESATIANSTGVMTIASSVLTTADINGGSLDGVTIGAASAAAATVSSLSVSDGNITNAGDVALDTISADGTTIGVTLTDNTAAALDIKEASNSYLKFDTTNSSELITAGESFTVASGKTFTTDTADINGGAIDGTTIGANSAAAGTFTSIAGTTATLTNAQVTNIKANDGTAAIAIADSTGAVTISTAVELDGGNVTINESSASVDFRVESNGHAHALFVDGSEDHVGIKTSAPAYDLDISGSTDAVKLPQGNTSARPTAATGIIRFNTQTGQYEGCQDGSTYVNFAIAGDAPTFTKESTTGDGSTSTFSAFFSSAPESANNVFVYIDNVYQEPTENYTVSGTNITFTSAPHSGARIFAITGADNTALATGGVARSETSSTNFTSSATNIFTFNGASYRSAEIYVQMTDTANTEYSAMKGVVVHDGTTAFITVFGITNTGSTDLGTLTANYNSGTVEVKAVSTGGQTAAKVQYSLASV